MNAGISGDRTQHVLWRLENGNIDKLSPKLAVLMYGSKMMSRPAGISVRRASCRNATGVSR